MLRQLEPGSKTEESESKASMSGRQKACPNGWRVHMHLLALQVMPEQDNIYLQA